MNKSCKSGSMAADWKAVEELDYCIDNRDYVNALLDISDETTLKDQEPYELPNETGWEQSIRGWRRYAPFSCLFLAQQKSRKAKPEVTDFHCLLCADLKSLKLSEAIPEAPLKTKVSLLWEVQSRTPTTFSSCIEEEPSDFPFQERSIITDPLRNKLFGDELSQHSKTLHPLQPNDPCPLLKETNVAKVPLISNLVVLSPVRKNVCPTLRIPKRPEDSNLYSAEEYSKVTMFGITRPVGGKVGIDKASYSNPILETVQGSLTSNQGSVQHQYHLLSDLTIPFYRRVQMTINTSADTLSRDTPLSARKPRQELIRSPLRQNSWQKPNLCLKSKTLRMEEPKLPMLLGTRVQIPVSSHRLL